MIDIAIRKTILVLLLLVVSACSNQQQLGTSDDSSTSYDQPLNTNQQFIDQSDIRSPEEETLSEQQKRIMMLVKSGEKPGVILNEYGGTVERTYDEMNMVAGYVHKDEIIAMGEDDRVIQLEFDKMVEVKPAQMVEWGSAAVQAPQALNSNFTGKNVKIAVVDSGIATHEDLQIAGGVSMVDYTDRYHDDNGHGTHVAGIIGAKNNDYGIVGVAPDSELYAVKVLDQDGVGYMSDVIAGIEWAIKNNIDIINLSLGSAKSSMMMEAIVNEAAKQNILVIAASGNEGSVAGTEDIVGYPGRYPSVIAVGAIDENNQRAAFSSTGATVELAAPGVQIVSTFPNNVYVRMDGTSSATPFVSGVAALVKEVNPTVSVSQLRGLLQKESVDLGEQGRDPWFGYGLVQAPIYFRDVYGHWARKDINAAYQKKWMVGAPDQKFNPSKALTRAEGAAIFTRLLDLKPNTSEELNINDVSKRHWAFNDIKAVVQNGIMVGTGPQTFKPDSSITREQIVAMLYRALGSEEQVAEAVNPFEDVASTRWSYPAIITMNRLGVIKGVTATKFAPTQPLKRSEIAAMLNRFEPTLK